MLKDFYNNDKNFINNFKKENLVNNDKEKSLLERILNDEEFKDYISLIRIYDNWE